ncbi:hypothetical protein [Halalkalicoccus jeotgali]|uniref:Uncharacterized protein n=1 Tax=Halalkalicoccus jeotgali (strain DSM 18796 / CECT 7217 / JCM 14584 / KCTC 4019 / B3) TaxID=795797 RepID=D8J826_HALJB|nr:hypothetical protein [Halalkalicoccus jeotgali]ADJ14139.1 hypothetical protein HacjB3_03740 [Halalkalicoccus jeotgali B3]ELY34679.1 hypothetical protein C497_15553 [Halalkalicoccus jeotgali B3]
MNCATKSLVGIQATLGCLYLARDFTGSFLPVFGVALIVIGIHSVTKTVLDAPTRAEN